MNTEQLHWFKSSYSDGEGGNCIEVAYDWHKSSYSSGGGGECVEVSTSPATIHIRDSKNLQAPHVDVAPAAWSAFVAYACRR
ncbi:DUF397 domain-containing protein [Streptomyces poriferorum]|uniref:DUF397 domain-containing protein n=1 Tax=Streptomyces TaxID=1883 RepID=UPI00273E2728|nr:MULTISPECIES: DUF397 domain-containing protein [unclassified Streptomyces]WLQ49038.1 DUF397 domain-containing protein [Streptomyces sp. Alt1]WSI63850.1 DUF397 domain-containing protein [Streptomyces sp. NBC_01336]